MHEVWFYGLLSVFVVSLMSFVGVFSLSLRADKLSKMLIYFISFSAGALFGDAFLHLLPEASRKGGFSTSIAAGVLFGIGIFFVLEKVINWKHCHMPFTKKHVHSFAYTNLVGDGLHNFMDGMIIGASYIVSIPIGVATTIAVVLHEIPQEIGDFGVLLHAGFSRTKALMTNFFSALAAVLGLVAALFLSGKIEGLESILIPIAAGGFIYIAGSDLIPELHKDSGNLGRALLQLSAFIAGIIIMALLLLIS